MNLLPQSNRKLEAMNILPRQDLYELVLKEPGIHNTVVLAEFDDHNIQSITKNSKDFILVYMNDAIRPESDNAPTEDQVCLILNKNTDSNHKFNIVSCRAGQSRSSAVAFLLLCQTVHPIEAAKIWDVKKHYPNELILLHGMNILGKNNLLGKDMYRVIKDFYEQIAVDKGWKITSVTKYFKD